ncbi:hypothetical protein C8R44DRAFT_927106 [Mycena epipterygia]|nr:hypothetical protein C8R44DRAFT_927106 [Mycena epipterygia]
MPDDFCVPTSDPSEEALLAVPSSDPYEEVIIPGFSQRDETSDEVDKLIQALYDKSANRAARRAVIEADEAARRTELEAQSESATTQSRTRSRSRSPPIPPKRQRRGDDSNEIDLELLRLQYGDMEAERDGAQEQVLSLQADYDQLRTEHRKLQFELQQYKGSLSFFQKETGRWRWAAANAFTRITTAMREFQGGGEMAKFIAAMGVVSDVLKHPDGKPT